jgi:hypothetical protein
LNEGVEESTGLEDGSQKKTCENSREEKNLKTKRQKTKESNKIKKVETNT